MDDITNTPIGKPKRKTVEPAPLEIPADWPTQVPVPIREPEKVPA